MIQYNIGITMEFIVPRASALPTTLVTRGYAATSCDHRSGEKGNGIMETHIAINRI